LKWLESIDLKEVVIDENSQIRRIWYYPLWTKEISPGAQIIYGTGL
jgi:hypothetical protein